jgi:hypothetical protein
MLDMLASLQSFGRSPVSIDTWKIFCNIGASWTAHSLSILLGILLGPDDFDGLTFDSNFSSPSCFMIIVYKIKPIIIQQEIFWQKQKKAFQSLTLTM